MSAIRPEPRMLSGQNIRLEPLTDEHLEGLFKAIATPKVFEFGFGGGLSALPESLEAFSEWNDKYHQSSNNNYAVVHTGADELVVGCTTLGDFDSRREATHIGWTAYDPRVWGSVVNPEAKLLLLTEAFDAGFGRVKIQTDVLNERSRAAILGIGAKFEGVIRREQPRADGTWRDSAVYSVIIDEWPQVREHLRERVSNAPKVALSTHD
ncbi:MAG: GNAT family N-acetyltransferase [Microbacteriaceae bacterium]|nr:GNAT family N-acetyltransferase [Cryobacterium sp.]MCC6376281.1 GNAT family N-acetyltransferase [Microbacteriaceae bacterium]